MNTLTKLVDSIVKSRPAVRRLLVVGWHLIGAVITFALAFLIRFEGTVPMMEWAHMWLTLPILLSVYFVVFSAFRVYSGMWLYFSVDDLARMGMALVTATAFFAMIVFGVRTPELTGFPRSIIATEFLLMGFWMSGGRFAVRYFRMNMEGGNPSGVAGERMMVVARVADADILARAARAGGMGSVVAVVTDEAEQDDMTLHGIRIYAPIGKVAKVVRQTRAQCVLILPPFNHPAQMNEIVAACVNAGVVCSFRTIPSMGALATGEMRASSIREVDIEDLLGRGVARLDRTEVRRFLKGKKVMVTGAGGSIGAELCRQIVEYEPARLVLFESSEYALYAIDKELRQKSPNLAIITFAGDVRHVEEIEAAIGAAGGIDVIYHTAAYKHVPLMENNVAACFRTNVLGTARLAEVAVRMNVDRFVMISSDKAVRPSSIMGVTKRIAERTLMERPISGTSFVSVRFGNVLGSSGSVVPLFKEQIARGGPVTVTTPETRRFFMTIPESVDLVLLAASVGHGGEIMVLDMGQPVRVVDLARRMIELSGFLPDKDIKIEFTGMRPGEKEYEEVMTEDENVVRTSYDKIRVMRKTENGTSAPRVDLAAILRMVEKNDDSGLRALAKEYVPESSLTP
jgi:FlaA1/EpsC-like NDP-sugar epimerase